MAGKDPFEALGLVPTASPEEVKAAYRAAARRMHPDVGGDEESFKSLTRAAHAALEIANGTKPNPFLPNDHVLHVDKYDRHAHSPPPPPNVWSSNVLGGALFWILPVAGSILMLSAAAGEHFVPIYLASMSIFALLVAVVLRRHR